MSFDCCSDSLDVFSGQKKLVVLAPHPDDESLACGGLLSRAFADAGAHVICLTDGSASHPGSIDWPAKKLAAQRHKEMVEAISAMGGTSDDLTWLGLPDSKMYQVDQADVASDIIERVAAFGGEHIFVPAVEDHHEDHKATAQIALKIREQRPDWSFYSYPVWSRWDDANFACNIAHHQPCYVAQDVSREQKRAAIHAHQTQIGGVILDDPDGFTLPARLIEKFIEEDEVFWRMP